MCISWLIKLIKLVVVNGRGLSIFYITLTHLLKVCSHPRFPWKILQTSVSTLTSPNPVSHINIIRTLSVVTSQPVVIIFLPLVDVVHFQSAVALYTATVYNLITSFPADPDRLDSTRLEHKHSHLTLRRLMSYIYGAPILDVSRSHTTTQHSR